MLKRNKRLLIIMACALFSLGGCATAEQKEAYKKIEAQAKTNAINYISNKYDMETQVVDVVVEKVESSTLPSNEPTGFATVTLKNDDKEFQVYINGEKELAEGRDNYQAELICEQMAEDAKQISGLEAEEIFYDVVNEKSEMLVETYYNGKNLDDVVEEIEGKVDYKIVTLGANLQDYDGIALKEQLKKCNELYILNCTKERDFNIIKEMESGDFFLWEKNYVLYVKDYIHASSSKSHYITVEKQEYDGFIVCVTDGSYCDVNSKSCDVKEWEEDFHNEPKQVFDSYSVETDGNKLFIYVDKDKIKADNYEEAISVITYMDSKKRHFEKEWGKTLLNEQYVVNGIIVDNKTDILFTVVVQE